jgi:hypothetical protein
VTRNRSGSVRLRPGVLRGQVEDYLREHSSEHGPTEIGHALGRSSGAIANTLSAAACPRSRARPRL